MIKYIKLGYVFLLCFITSCNCNINEKSLKNTPQIFTGWWVYGEGQHIFKDEETLKESDLLFLNEDVEELVELYLAVCEMEYYPLECVMTGFLTEKNLQVTDFEITHVEGCED